MQSFIYLMFSVIKSTINTYGAKGKEQKPGPEGKGEE